MLYEFSSHHDDTQQHHGSGCKDNCERHTLDDLQGKPGGKDIVPEQTECKDHKTNAEPRPLDVVPTRAGMICYLAHDDCEYPDGRMLEAVIAKTRPEPKKQLAHGANLNHAEDSRCNADEGLLDAAERIKAAWRVVHIAEDFVILFLENLVQLHAIDSSTGEDGNQEMGKLVVDNADCSNTGIVEPCRLSAERFHDKPETQVPAKPFDSKNHHNGQDKALSLPGIEMFKNPAAVHTITFRTHWHSQVPSRFKQQSFGTCHGGKLADAIRQRQAYWQSGLFALQMHKYRYRFMSSSSCYDLIIP